MQEFNTGGGGDQTVEIVGVPAPGQQQHEWAQSLAAGFDDIEHKPGGEGIVDRRGLLNASIDSLEVGTHDPEDVCLLKGHAMLPAQSAGTGSVQILLQISPIIRCVTKMRQPCHEMAILACYTRRVKFSVRTIGLLRLR